VLDVVDSFDPVEANGDVAKLEFQGFPAEEEVDAVKDAGMEYLIPDHFVVEEECECAGVFTVSLGDLVPLVAPNVGKRAIDRSQTKSV